MARIDDLINEVADPELRLSLKDAAADLRADKKFGLVFEDHIPETVSLPGLTIQVGDLIQYRKDINLGRRYRVEALTGDTAKVQPAEGGKAMTADVDALHLVKRFGEPIYPGLSLVASKLLGSEDRPSHVVIDAENFHAIQLLTYL